MPELRIISLLPSGTEILHALGGGEFQVGRSHECDFPPGVQALPVCSRPNIAVDGSSAAIDALVQERTTNALSIYDLDAELMAELRPTHIVTQTQCKVCAVSLDDVERALRSLTGTEAQVVALEPHTLADVWSDVRRVARACELIEAGERLIADLKQRMDGISATVAGLTRPTVATLEWLEPLMVAGNWIPELVERAGGVVLFGEAGQHSPYFDWSRLVDADPDVIVAFPCGFDLPRTRMEMHWITDQTGWSELKAVRTRRVYVCDGNQFMNRPGPRLVESLAILGAVLHPNAFRDQPQIGWESFP